MIKNEKVKIFFLIHLLLFFNRISIADISLSKYQHGVFGEDTYYPKEDLVVESGNILTFKAGSRLIFSKSHSLNVYGKLILRGLPKNPIVLTSDLDSIWNGISVFDNGKIIFENVLIQNSVVGVTIPDSNSIVNFQNVFFKKCKRDIRIGEEFIAVENEPFSIEKFNLNIKDIVYKDTLSKPIVLHELSKRPTALFIFQCTSAALAIGSFISWGYLLKKTEYTNNEYQSEISQNVNIYKNKRDKYNKLSNISLITGISSTVFFYTITFKLFTSLRRDK
jgi:hypothetical protein